MQPCLDNRGWTLTEVMVTAVILAALSAVAVPSYTSYVDRARKDTARATCEMIAAAVIRTHQEGMSVEGSDADAGVAWAEVGLNASVSNDEFWVYSYGPAEKETAIRPDYAIEVRPRPGGALNRKAQYKGRSGSYRPLQKDYTDRWQGLLSK